jgi:mRNA interferase MazF
MINRGDIFYADLNPVIGSEISKTRPVLVISNDINNKFSNTVTVIPISSSKDKKIYPFEVFLKALDTKLKNDSIAKVNQIRTIDKQRLRNKIASLNTLIISEIEQAICIHLDLNVSL